MALPTALITGSTAGLGAAFARQLAAQGYELVLVARDADRLRTQAHTLTTQYGIRARRLVADLTTDDGVAAVRDRLADHTQPVHLLVNNAGHGLAGDFADTELEDELKLLRLHVQTTLELCHTAAQTMRRQRGGRIINVASVAGYTSTGTYSAAKAYVINFSEALHEQLARHGVVVTALCPGLVRTEFHGRSGISVDRAKGWMWLNADDVVREGLAANAQGAKVHVPSRTYQAVTATLKVMPDSVVRWAYNKRDSAAAVAADEQVDVASPAPDGAFQTPAERRRLEKERRKAEKAEAKATKQAEAQAQKEARAEEKAAAKAAREQEKTEKQEAEQAQKQEAAASAAKADAPAPKRISLPGPPRRAAHADQTQVGETQPGTEGDSARQPISAGR
ncbi:SDR family NAD(P)-dependent oxidoreductase [Nesterenkonia marinintestina]|uniref:SDR family NAD(P)-dependent oxidoreductase n=1 Tax=Nesterenkonia marinintestina TaxID=2979865 RepID=UPI0028FC1CB4|nr:SDR family oxidoreductase [Nesterenkonia sp. GX14115]